MGFIMTIIVGGIIGWLTQVIMNKDVPGGIFGNIILGIIGSSLGGWLLNDWGWTVGGIAVFPAIIGAIILVLIYDLITSR